MIKAALLGLVVAAAVAAQTLTLALAGPTSFKPAGQVVLNLTLAGSAGQNVSGVQFSIPAPGGPAVVTAGAASTAASKDVNCSQVPSNGNLTCVLVGLNNTPYADGVVAQVAITLPNPIVQGLTWTMPVVVASTIGNAVATTSSAPINPCDLDGSGAVARADMIASINQIFNQSSCVDLIGNGSCNIFDVLRVIIAAQPSGVCKVGP